SGCPAWAGAWPRTVPISWPPRRPAATRRACWRDPERARRVKSRAREARLYVRQWPRFYEGHHIGRYPRPNRTTGDSVYRHPFRAASAVLITVLSMLAGGLASPAAAGAAATGDAPLVLITGSLIQPGTGAHGGAAVVPAGRGLGASLLTLRLGGRTYAIPSAPP